MKHKPDHCTVREIIDLKKSQLLVVNPEYQRGSVWGLSQKRKLIDSIMRNYPIPLIYMHYLVQSVAGLKSQRYEIIDGQQRINAIYEFCEDGFSLFDPLKDQKEARFPDFIKSSPCPWAGKKFSQIGDELKEQFLDQKLSIVKIETDSVHEARDLFVRLQAGMPLNSQEKRDAWPGQFTDFILRLGGKPGLARYPGHDFFTNAIGTTKTDDRGKVRQLAAQTAMLYMHRKKYNALCDVSSSALDSFYHENIDFDIYGDDAARFTKLLDILSRLLTNQGLKKLQAHEVIHLILFADDMMDHYVSSWETGLVDAFQQFRKNFTEGKSTKNSANPSPYWLQYGVRTRVNSDKFDTINLRHKFFSAEMTRMMRPIPKDPKRQLNDSERDAVYYRDNRTCQVCGKFVRNEDAEIHHLQEHQRGGETIMDNSILVHRHCHPKGLASVKFYDEYLSQKE